MLQLLYLDVLKVDHVLYTECVWEVTGGANHVSGSVGDVWGGMGDVCG
jgi:hypothetical protein